MLKRRKKKRFRKVRVKKTKEKSGEKNLINILGSCGHDGNEVYFKKKINAIPKKKKIDVVR